MRTRKRCQVGTAGLVIRYRNGTCAHECRACGHWEAFSRWRQALRSARAHAADHAAGTTDRSALTPQGSRLVARPRRRSPLRRLAVAGVVLVLAVLAFTITVAAVTSRAAPREPAPSIGIVVTTTTATVPTTATAASPHAAPTVAGPPATDAHGQWIPEPDPSTSTSQGAQGGGR